MGDSTDTDSARTSDSTSGRPHPTPSASTTTMHTKPIEDMDATTMPETKVPLIPTEPHNNFIGTTEGTKIITEQTTEDFMNTEVGSMTFEPIVDDSNGTVSGRAGSQSGVIAGTVLAIFLAIFLVIFTAIFVVIVMSKKQISLPHTNQQLQDISNGKYSTDNVIFMSYLITVVYILCKQQVIVLPGTILPMTAHCQMMVVPLVLILKIIPRLFIVNHLETFLSRSFAHFFSKVLL